MHTLVTSTINLAMRELRYAVRLLVQSPGFTFVAAAALAVGIGANITIFGFVNALVLRPLDVPEPERLVRANAGGASLMPLILESDYVEYRERNQSFSSLALFRGGWMTPLRTEDAAEMVAITPVSGNYFQTLGIEAALGRVVVPADDEPGAPGVLVVSAAGVARYFGSDADVVGRVVYVNHEPFTIVGVTPNDFSGTVYPNIPQFYTAFVHPKKLRDDISGYLIGRLGAGVSQEQAQADLSRIAAQLTSEQKTRKPIQVYPGTAGYPQFVRMMTSMGSLFMVIVGAVLWIACCNIAVLLLARAAARRREFGIRLALGASRWQLMRQLLVESVLLACIGGSGAAFVAHATSGWLTQIYLPVPMPIALVYAFDWRVLAFAIAVSLAATLMFGLGPALHAVRTDVVSSVKEGDATPILARSRTSGSLVVTQVALSMVLLATAGLMVRSASAPQDRQFDADGVLMAVVRLTGAEYPADRKTAFIDDAIERLEEIPGVLAASAADHIPLTNNQGLLTPSDFRPVDEDVNVGEDRPQRDVYTNRVTRGHFRTLRIPLFEGRDFDTRNRAASPAVGIVNETLAGRFWPNDYPVGEQVRAPDGTVVTIIGLARDSRYMRKPARCRSCTVPPRKSPSVACHFSSSRVSRPQKPRRSSGRGWVRSIPMSSSITSKR